MKYQINLFPPRKENITDRIIYFSFNYLRYILVITQMVVIVVFFYRFQVDQEIVDLKDSVRQKGEIIAVSSSLLKDVQAIELKAKSIEQVAIQQEVMKQTYQYFFSNFPSDLFLTKLEFDETGLHIEGYTQNIEAVRLYNARLLQEKRFKQTKLVSLKKQDFNFIFIFTLTDFIPE